MNRYITRYVGLVAASVSIATIISTLLGRVYFLSYFEILGVPTSEVSVNIADYTVMSLDTAIYGIGLTVTASLLIALQWQIPQSDRWQWNRIVGGIVAPVLSIGFLWVMSMLLGPLFDFPGGAGLIRVSALFIIVFAFVILLSGFPLSRWFSSWLGRNKDEDTYILVVLLLLLVYAIVILANPMEYAAQVGKADAQAALEATPTIGMIEFVQSDNYGSTQSKLVECSKDSIPCVVKLVWTNERHAYVRIEAEDGTSEEALYVVPLERIDSFVLDTGNP